MATTGYIINEDGFNLIIDGLFSGLEIQAPAAAAGTLTLSTAELTVVDGDKLGQIDFQAPLEDSGTDAVVVGASIWAEADDTFAVDNNSTELVFAVANSGAVVEAMRIDHDGKVGIGTASPGVKLHIKSTTAGVGLKLDRADTGRDAFIHFATGGAYADWFVGLDNDADDFQIKTANNATPEFIITTSGNVGIGVTTFGASMAGGMAMALGTDPTGDVADQFAFFAHDFVAGNTCPYFRTENGTVIGLNQSLLDTDDVIHNRLALTGGFKANLVTKTGAYTTTADDYTILCDALGGSFTITLIALASHLEGIYHIKKIDSSANTVTLDGNGAETIDGALTAVITTQYESITIQAGSEWSIL